MKKLLAAALLLVLGLSWTPLMLALLAVGAHHRCCHRIYLESTQQVTAPAICGSARCCVSSDRTTTLPAVSPAPRLEMQTMGFVPIAPVENVAEAITPDAVSPYLSCFDVSMILRI